MSRNSITPLRAFCVIGLDVSTSILSPAGMAQDAAGFGGPGRISTRHMRQLPAIDRRS